MSSKAPKALKHLRRVLRHTRHVDNVQTHVLQRFRGEVETHPVAKRFSVDFLAYLDELKQQDKLIKDYTGEKTSQQKRIAKTANLVGLGLPEVGKQ